MGWMRYSYAAIQAWRPGIRAWGDIARMLSALVIVIVSGGFPTLVLASSVPSTYAEYVGSNPAANALLLNAPITVSVHFSTSPDIQHSMLTVLDTGGKRVDTGSVQADEADPATLLIAMQADQSEIYIVNWHTVSAHGSYRDAGSFRFFVHASPALKSVLTSAPSQSTKPAPVASLRPDRISIPLWWAGLIGLVGLAVGAAVMWSFAQQAEQRRSIASIVPLDDDE